MASNSSEVVDANSTPTFFHTDPEKGSTAHLPCGRPIERVITPGGHPIDFSQPAIPVQHRKFGNPLPAALISFSTGFFFLGLLNIGSEYCMRSDITRQRSATGPPKMTPRALRLAGAVPCCGDSLGDRHWPLDTVRR